MLETLGTSMTAVVGEGTRPSLKVVQLNKKRALGRSRQTFMFSVSEILEERPGQSESLNQHREQQGKVLGASDREFMCGVKVDDLWDGVKRGAVLSQDVLSVFTLSEFHVHETLAAP